MTGIQNAPSIPESYLEHRQNYANPWIDRWVIPNPFINPLFSLLRNFGVALTDISFNKDAANIDETYLNIAVRNFDAAIRVGLDNVTYLARNPDWNMVPDLVEIFDATSAKVQDFVQHSPISQILTLSIHVLAGKVNLEQQTRNLVQSDRIGSAHFYGISAYRDDGYVVIDKSNRHDGAAFIRLQRKFPGNMKFAEIAPIIYDEEIRSLELIGISGID